MPTSREELREALIIDDDDLDKCLVEQPSLFYSAAEASSLADSKRDTVKLELKELKAQLDQDIRRKAIEDEEKLSETQLTNRIITLPVVKALERKLLALSKEAADCSALKESYEQRSYALKDLNARQNAQMMNLGLERGSVGTRREVGDRVRERAENLRRENRKTSQSRFQPRGESD
jgi:hypothetical protein